MSSPRVDTAFSKERTELFDDVAYVYDGTLEGLLCAIFEAYALHENPSDVACESEFQQRLFQRVHTVCTDTTLADRVYKGIVKKGGSGTFDAIRRASVCSKCNAGTTVYRFVRYVMDEHAGKRSPLNNIAHPSVAPLFELTRSVSHECEYMRQFIRFEHLKDETGDVWFARCNPKHNVVPLIMNHFVERFSIQPFIIYDENHGVCGAYDGTSWHLIDVGQHDELFHLPGHCSSDAEMQHAWKRFYDCVSIDARYNPELRRAFMPKRFWKNIVEVHDEVPALVKT